MSNTSPLPAIAKSIAQAENILLISHIRPDGDAIGSLLGLGWALETAGKRVQMVMGDGVPKALAFLPGSERIQKSIAAPYDLSILLDCSELSRAGDVLSKEKRPDINIDHHPTNDYFASINLVIPEAVATAEILARALPDLGLTIPTESASALLTGLLTDTLGLRTPNMRPEVLRLAATLMEHGADLPALYFQAMVQRDFRAVRLWGAGLSRLQREGRIVWTSLTLEDKVHMQYPGRDDADLINVLSSIAETDIAFILVEQSRDKVKISWRSHDGIDISQLATSFGGGGHKNAAGAEVNGSLSDVEERVRTATQVAWERQVRKKQATTVPTV